MAPLSAVLQMMHPEMQRLMMESSRARSDGDGRRHADLALAAFRAAPDPWATGRFFLFTFYTAIFPDFPDIANASDKKAYQSVLHSSEEPAHFRALAAGNLALLFGRDDREQVADYLRRVIEIAEQLDPQEAERVVLLPRDNILYTTVGAEVTRFAEIARHNLRGHLNPHDPAVRLAMASPLVRQHGVMQEPTLYRRFCDDRWPAEIRARLEIGGQACDCCGKTLEELGVARLDCCTRCKMAYYCSRECQRKQWKAGHKQACRKPGDFHRYDWVRIRGWTEGGGLNEEVAMVIGRDEKEGHWDIQFFGENGNLFSADGRRLSFAVATENLYHIRPAK